MAAVQHVDQHANANDAFEMLDAKGGADSSEEAISHDFMISQNQARVLNLRLQVLLDDSLGWQMLLPSVQQPSRFAEVVCIGEVKQVEELRDRLGAFP
ncbi:MAG: hypothetical protein U1A77_10135 [Pirellulales bacterium]